MSKSIRVYKRRLKVRELYSKGKTSPMQIKEDPEFVKLYGQVSISTIQSDLRAITKWYLKAVEENGHILAKQAEYILRHLDQLNMVKARLNDIADRAKEKQDLKGEVAACRAILNELEQEAKIRKLIDASKIIKQYIHIDKIGILVNNVVGLLKEFVPDDRLKYALERLKQIGNTVIDVEKENK